MKHCSHLWRLDHEVYFERLSNHLRYRDRLDEIVFPAKCGICGEERDFNEGEWVEHLERDDCPL